ncbi:hypothetical protein [Denitrobaculum tricleocarpae]|uniref:Cytochrome c domain-containing protein n=1 Tax=Denitrobaculum tricleocarpae TaxID=2591009 RepID=A0A545T3X2_9PROT|nr:hypothetical protein [Denitrobaculum tricleocarpae]TQV71923.1 hypothetical protein FKG95_26470 [Denitrobaculum tricleocarpae]
MTEKTHTKTGTCAKTAMLSLAAFGVLLMSDTVTDRMPAYAASDSKEASSDMQPASPQAMVLPLADVAHGRQLFVSKGCVICHSINGVGGRAAPALDAIAFEQGDEVPAVDPLDFVARMWRGAPAMLDLQAIELGYQIELTANDLVDLAVFASDAGAQSDFTLEDVPEPMWDWMLNEPYWEDESWPERLLEGFPDSEDSDTAD